MELIKKTLNLNYTELKNDKTIHKSYHFDINGNVDNDTVKEIAIELAKLVSKDIENYSISTKSII